MTISGLGLRADYVSENSINVKHVGEKTVSQESSELKSQLSQLPSIDEATLAEAASEQTFTSFDFAQQYDARMQDLTKRDADISSLDQMNSASQAKSSTMMRQYQQFMGDRVAMTNTFNSQYDQAKEISTEETAQRQIENFNI